MVYTAKTEIRLIHVPDGFPPARIKFYWSCESSCPWRTLSTLRQAQPLAHAARDVKHAMAYAQKHLSPLQARDDDCASPSDFTAARSPTHTLSPSSASFSGKLHGLAVIEE